MKVILFLSKFTFICNISFLLFVLFSWLEVRTPFKARVDQVFEIPFLKQLVITLGFSAIIINIVMSIIYLVFLFSGRLKIIPRWIILTNLVFLLIQFYYFFS